MSSIYRIKSKILFYWLCWSLIIWFSIWFSDVLYFLGEFLKQTFTDILYNLGCEKSDWWLSARSTSLGNQEFEPGDRPSLLVSRFSMWSDCPISYLLKFATLLKLNIFKCWSKRMGKIAARVVAEVLPRHPPGKSEE